MASTFLSLHYHIVFSTKHRQAILHDSWRFRLFEYLGGTVHGLAGIPECIGGWTDHIHLLVGLKATHPLADFVRELKKSGTSWIQTEIGMRDFAWQEGYAAFTVSPTARDSVKAYIDHQGEHHRTRSFREELVEFLQKAGVEYEDKYLD